MTKILTQVVALTLAAAATFSTFAGANSLATQQFAKAEQTVASAQLQMTAAQTVVVVGHHAKA